MHANTMMNICIVHNNETDRLNYLIPKVNAFAALLAAKGIEVYIHEIGPEVSGMAERVARHTPLNRLKRALQTSSMNSGFRRLDPRQNKMPKYRFAKRLREFRKLLKNNRKLEIEQEVLYAHLKCWEIASRSGLLTAVLESDAVFPNRSPERLSSLITYLIDNVKEKELVYVDLAGGCDVRTILNSWCFENFFGRVDFEVPEIDDVVFHQLPSMTTNTVGGYIVNGALARVLCDEMMRTRPLLAPDWAINVFALNNESVRSAVCIHSSPALLRQGSADGTYTSTIDARR